MPKKKKTSDEFTCWYLMLPGAHKDMFEDDPAKHKGFPPFDESCILGGSRIWYYKTKDALMKDFFFQAKEARADEFYVGTLTVKKGQIARLKRLVEFDDSTL